MTTRKEPVKIRQKKLKDGNISLYLSIYYEGKRTYEFLKLYLIPERTKADKEQNKSTLALAEAIKAQRIVDLQRSNHGFQKKAQKVSFFTYAESHISSYRENQQSTIKAWRSMILKVRIYEKRTPFYISQIDKNWINGFKQFLSSTERKDSTQKISVNTQKQYFANLRCLLRKAASESLLPYSVLDGVKAPPSAENERAYLTIDELQRLIETPCKNIRVRSAFLFSCFTGLRISDILKLTWDDVFVSDGRVQLIFKQKKTGKLEYLTINEQAVQIMRQSCPDTKSRLVFSIPSRPTIRKQLSRWVKAAGINKHITFHCARHTFATMLLTLDVDIYTVSKLLGHSDISTTQIYAKIIDKKKVDAVERIPKLL